MSSNLANWQGNTTKKLLGENFIIIFYFQPLILISQYRPLVDETNFPWELILGNNISYTTTKPSLQANKPGTHKKTENPNHTLTRNPAPAGKVENNQKAINNTNWPNKSCSSGISGVSAFPIYFSNRPVSVSSIDRDKETHKAKVSLAEDDAATTVRQRHLIEISHQARGPRRRREVSDNGWNCSLQNNCFNARGVNPGYKRWNEPPARIVEFYCGKRSTGCRYGQKIFFCPLLPRLCATPQQCATQTCH